MTIFPKLILFASVLFLAGCSENENTKYGKAASPAAATQQATPLSAPNPAAASGTAVAINPPHGQPNHRCDIPEGAPLNAPMQPNLKAAAPQFKPQPQGQGAVAPGTNPPHGQPGHDCAIPVGAPLNK
ncbi:hypothetical protein [Pontibacter beigongshangensis]|uniref:hypothetical protein n=1 Tax=Pontibacter beigongshangensis TaxID=2574733 RepID=UPI00164F4142|nr:hypothetical protein [Pontibacter beigongshangensis]